jgi:hypothetical protein
VSEESKERKTSDIIAGNPAENIICSEQGFSVFSRPWTTFKQLTGHKDIKGHLLKPHEVHQ